MSIIGEYVTVMKANDPTVTGRRGQVIMETANTVRLASEKGRIALAKEGTVFRVSGSGRFVAGEDIAGRLEDRLRSKKK
jgi:RNase P/RNase MRP subunit p29